MPNELAPWPFNYEPSPGGFAALFNTLTTSLFPTAVVGTATTKVYVGIPHFKTTFVSGASIHGGVAATGSGTVTATLFAQTGATARALTAAYDLTTSVTNYVNADVPITATDQNATLAPGDTLYWSVAASGTITGSPDLKGVVLAAIRS